MKPYSRIKLSRELHAYSHLYTDKMQVYQKNKVSVNK